MTTHHTAQGLASLGRHGDTMLVHMSPHEVAGLNYLAKKQGTKLTVNPDTGLPEAFSLGGFFSSFLPTIAGMAFAPETGGFSMAPLLAGAATGAGLAAVKGENPLMGGLMGGLGGYGGGQLGYSLGKAAGANAITPGLEGTMAKIGGEGAADAIGTNVLQYQAPGMGGLGFAAPSSLPEINAQNIITAAGQGAGSGSSGASAFNPMEKLSQAFSGAKNISGMGDMAQADAWKAFTGAGGTGTQLAMPVGGALLGGLEPTDLYGQPMKPSDKDRYDPYSRLNLSGDTGLRLVAEGGYIDGKGYALGGTVTTGGLSDLYATTDTPTNTQLSRDGYGVGRLDSLAREQSLAQAQTMGYAMGGPVSFADGGDAMKLSDEVAPADQSMGIASLAPTTEVPGQSTTASQAQTMASALSAPTSSDSSIISDVAIKLQQNPNYQPTNPIEAAIVKQLKGTDQQGQAPQGLGSLGPAQPSQPMAATFNPSQAIGPTYFAGMNAPRGFEKGGYLDGAGDGMSDSIPATIEGKQPARLADGEFVVPADVVSHIGNGSSKAGSKRLYSMLDRVRKARTGTKKQGREINPAKYMPA